MRRIAWTLVLLLVSSTAVFMIGWVSLRLEPGKYAVLVSKTGGVDPTVLRSGEFRWTPAILLPTNLSILSFIPAATERVVNFGGTLPSAEVYQEFMAGDPDFSWAVDIRISASVRPESLPVLVADFGVQNDEDLSAWLAEEAEQAVAELRAAVIGLAGTAEGAGLLVSGAAETGLAATLKSQRPHLAVRGLAVLSAKVPDIALYESARALYLGYMETYRATVEPALTKASSQAAEEQVRMETLRRYGELLEQYPDLIDYLAIEAGIAPRPRPLVFGPGNTAPTPSNPAPATEASGMPKPGKP